MNAQYLLRKWPPARNDPRTYHRQEQGRRGRYLHHRTIPETRFLPLADSKPRFI
jgi:hypothetical protein